MRKFVLTFILFCGAVPAKAQPFSESMADCAALYQNAAQFVRSEADSEKLMVAARAWAQAAVEQYAKEGSPKDQASVWRLIDIKTGEWEAKSPGVFQDQEFHDWSAYCLSFGRAQGIDPTG